MNYRRITGLFGAAGALAVGTEIAQAQEDLGDSIANTVSSAVSSVATNSGGGGTVSGGESVERSEVDLGEEKDSPSRMRAAATTICHSSAEADIIIGNPRGGFAVNVRQT